MSIATGGFLASSTRCAINSVHHFGRRICRSGKRSTALALRPPYLPLAIYTSYLLVLRRQTPPFLSSVLSACVFRQFSFLFGTDTYQDLRKGKWRNSEELLEIVSVVIVDSECFFNCPASIIAVLDRCALRRPQREKSPLVLLVLDWWRSGAAVVFSGRRDWAKDSLRGCRFTWLSRDGKPREWLAAFAFFGILTPCVRRDPGMPHAGWR